MREKKKKLRARDISRTTDIILQISMVGRAKVSFEPGFQILQRFNG